MVAHYVLAAIFFSHSKTGQKVRFSNGSLYKKIYKMAQLRENYPHQISNG
jgi:hypothetical protein